MILVRKLALCATLLALVLSARPSPAQTPNISDLLSGKNVPLTLKLGDLTPDWRAFTLDGSALGLAIPSYFAGTSDTFTQGDTITAGDDVYLIAYQVQQKPIDMSLMVASGHPQFSVLTPDTTLSLTLINLHAISGLTAIRPFSLSDELAASADAAQRFQTMYQSVKNVRETYLSDAPSHLVQLDLALMQYINDNDNTFPNMKNETEIKSVLSPYTNSNAVFIQDGTNKPYLANTSLSGKKITGIDSPEDMVVFYDPSPDKGGNRYVAFADGHIKKVDAATWASLKKSSGVH